jgi:hypothetical protein
MAERLNVLDSWQRGAGRSRCLLLGGGCGFGLVRTVQFKYAALPFLIDWQDIEHVPAGDAALVDEDGAHGDWSAFLAGAVAGGGNIIGKPDILLV